MKFQNRSRWGLVTALLACLAVSNLAAIAPAHAQPNANVSFGVVDEDKLADGYKTYKAAVDAVDQREQDLIAKLRSREFLTAEQGKTFDTIVIVEKQTEAQKKQLADIVKIGLDNSAEYLSLNGKANRTEADNARLKTLTDMSTQNANAIRQLPNALAEIIRQQQNDVDKKYTDAANGVIQQVANDKKLQVIFRSQSLAWWSTTVDITDEVLKRLNK